MLVPSGSRLETSTILPSDGFHGMMLGVSNLKGIVTGSDPGCIQLTGTGRRASELEVQLEVLPPSLPRKLVEVEGCHDAPGRRSESLQ